MALQLTPSQISSMGEDRGPTVTIVSSILVALSTASVVLRFISRMNRRVGFGMDDWLSIGALVTRYSGIYTVDLVLMKLKGILDTVLRHMHYL